MMIIMELRWEPADKTILQIFATKFWAQQIGELRRSNASFGCKRNPQKFVLSHSGHDVGPHDFWPPIFFPIDTIDVAGSRWESDVLA